METKQVPIITIEMPAVNIQIAVTIRGKAILAQEDTHHTAPVAHFILTRRKIAMAADTRHKKVTEAHITQIKALVMVGTIRDQVIMAVDTRRRAISAEWTIDTIKVQAVLVALVATTKVREVSEVDMMEVLEEINRDEIYEAKFIIL
jgi:hypothetical protein